MAKYIIFAGLGGGFNSVCQQKIEDYNSEDEALADAYEIACEEYDSYGGMHGLFNIEDALAEDPSLTNEDLNTMYFEDLETWVVYYVKPITDDEFLNYINDDISSN